MTGVALALALGSAWIHALWNLLLARAEDSEAATAVALVAGTIAFAPVAALTWEVDGAALPYLAVSAALEVAYFVLLAAAYQRGELSLVYPLARGSAPVLVAIGTAVALGAVPSAGTVLGVVAVSAGILLVRGFGPGRDARSVAFALAIGVTVAAYTLFDKAGLRHAGPLPYLELVVLPSALVYPLVVARLRGRAALRRAVGWPAVIAGIAMFGAFALALAALKEAPDEFVPAIQACRETSIVLVVAAGALFLGERVSRARAVGAGVVALGVAVLVTAGA